MYNRYMYGIKSVDDDALEELKARDRRTAPALANNKNKKPKYIQGDSRYDLLSGLTYQQQLQYIPMAQRNEVEDYLLSDMITVSLNMDEYRKANEDVDIFQNSYTLLKSQALNTAATAKEKSKERSEKSDPEGGQKEDQGASDEY